MSTIYRFDSGARRVGSASPDVPGVLAELFQGLQRPHVGETYRYLAESAHDVVPVEMTHSAQVDPVWHRDEPA